MPAITLTEHGGPEVMHWTKVPAPTPAAGEVIVEVAATAVNRADLLQRQGNYPPPPGASEILGLECSGTIASVGAAISPRAATARSTAPSLAAERRRRRRSRRR